MLTYLNIFFFIDNGGSVVHFRDAYKTDCGKVLVGVDERISLNYVLIGALM